MAIDELTTILARYPAIVQPRTAPEALGTAGGESGARLWRFATGRGMLVARKWPVDGTGRAHLERIHGWLATTAGLDFVPVPLQGLDGRTLQELRGQFWELAPWLEGVPGSQFPLSNERIRLGYAALAAFHQRLAHESVHAVSPGLRARAAEIDGWRKSGFGHLRNALARTSGDHSHDLARRWLTRAEPLAAEILEELRAAAARELILQPCLRDIRPEHLLFTGDRVSGLIDFGAMDVDSVAGDLARLLADWPGDCPMARAEALDSYSAIRTLDVDELSVIEAFESSAALLGAGHWARWRFLEEREFFDPNAVERGLERGLARLQRLELRRQ